jgi:Flp pilus assembly protein TadG
MRRLLSNCRRFLADPKGNIAVLFAFAAIPMFGIMGAALDYSMANMQRTALQAAADNTILMLSKMMPLSDDELKTKGWKIFQANVGSTPLQYGETNLNIASTANGKLTLQINTEYPITIGSVMSKIFGTSPYMPVNVHSEVQWGNTRLRVALVLDNSGSMSSSNKIGALKTATKNLITTLSGVAKNPEDVYVSVIPFSKDVNIGTANAGGDYLDWTEWDSNHGYCTTDPSKSQNRCGTCSISGENKKSDCVAAGVCSLTQYTGKNSCTSHGGTWTLGVWTSNWGVDRASWNGCIMDRGKSAAPGTNADYDQKVDAVDKTKVETMFPVDDYSTCTQPMQGLTNNWSTLNTIVDNMQPNGSTNQPIGLVWGWQSLVGGGPLASIPMDSNYAYSQVIILLSDGLNTQDRWYGNGSSTSTSVDKRMYYSDSITSTVTGTCQNAKLANVLIYSVQVNTGGDPQSAVLKNCASDASKFFELKTSDGIISTFDQIGSALANIHISK